MEDKELYRLWKPAKPALDQLIEGKRRHLDEIGTPERLPLVHACTMSALSGSVKVRRRYHEKITSALAPKPLLLLELELEVGKSVYYACFEQGLESAPLLALDLLLAHIAELRRRSPDDADDRLMAMKEPLVNILLDRQAELGVMMPPSLKAWPANHQERLLRRVCGLAMTGGKKLGAEGRSQEHLDEVFCADADLARNLHALQRVGKEFEEEVRIAAGAQIFETAKTWGNTYLAPRAISLVLLYLSDRARIGGSLENMLSDLHVDLRTLIETSAANTEDDLVLGDRHSID